MGLTASVTEREQPDARCTASRLGPFEQRRGGPAKEKLAGLKRRVAWCACSVQRDRRSRAAVRTIQPACPLFIRAKTKFMKRRQFTLLPSAHARLRPAAAVAPAAQWAAGRAGRGQRFAKRPRSLPTGKIEVVHEFFSYACPHCNAFGPELDAWAKRLPADVTAARPPCPFVNAENFQRTYYALEAMGQVDAMHRKVFAAVHADRMRFDKPADIAAFMSKNGIDGTKFLEMFNSFSVQSKVGRQPARAGQLSSTACPRARHPGQVPHLAEHGRCTDRALAVSDYLIQQSRGSQPPERTPSGCARCPGAPTRASALGAVRPGATVTRAPG